MSFTTIDMSETTRTAVNVHNVYFRYTKNALILERMNIKILEGKIFGLLGSNGSGKTTLLRLILGRLKPESGSVSVFGVSPGSKHSDVPGSGVGYMPQDIALYWEFTIEEILSYYGVINHMNSNDIKTRIKLLTELLNIPKTDRQLSALSGGQQRLVSIAVTMIHRPRLLILDEPTVGVDSLIRCRIWDYLENICKNEGITVIVTTHYIEEAKSASNIGFVNNGYLLAQSSPQHLLRQYKCTNLEEVYYKLTILRRRSRRLSLKPDLFEARDDDSVEEENQKFDRNLETEKNLSFDRMFALFWRNYIQLKRNPLMFICFYTLTALIISLIGLVFHQNFESIPIAVYNAEAPADLTDLFIKQIDRRLLNVNQYNSTEYAINSVINGENLLVLKFHQNFSDGFVERIESPQHVSIEAIEESTVSLTIDMSNPIYTLFANIYLLKAFQSFIETYSQSIAYNPRAFTIPMDISAVYYNLSPMFKDYIAPGMLLGIQYCLTMVLTAFVFIFEQKNGCLERAFANGIQPLEIILVQVFWFIPVVTLQALLTTVLSFYVFDFSLMGSSFDAFLLLLVQGIHGMLFGIIISLVIKNDYNIMIIMVAATLPLWMISGVIWPLESLPSYAQWMCNWLPLTQPTVSLRSIMFRGWNSLYTRVFTGYLVNFGYIIILFTLSLIVLKKLH